MKVLVIGGTGFISGEIVRLTREAGHHLTLFNRGKAVSNPDIPTIFGDVDDLVSFKDQLVALNPEIVVHCICSTQKTSRDLVEVFKGQETRLLVLSSLDCYDLFQKTVRDHEIYGFPVSENGPLGSIQYYYRGLTKNPERDTYDKNLMTSVLLSASNEGNIVKPTIFRCPMVFGPKDPQYLSRHG
ncbi:MAG: NAD-dependent epimerase/dehydratase family protein, partial [Cyanobacteria bacterium NC_groundwater_1444_Ag_S-0.65um_54_12]|nr:NAD-dependent epimerase/dehydratase family protein [Cyanobacteria bacterium NC_groundwater_1444_Ag_S-0.65um_54_12]